MLENLLRRLFKVCWVIGSISGFCVAAGTEWNWWLGTGVGLGLGGLIFAITGSANVIVRALQKE